MIKAWTDCPFMRLGDIEGLKAPVRKIAVLSYDGNKYCTIRVGKFKESIKSGYIYQREGRYGEVPCLTRKQLYLLEKYDE